MTGTRPTGAAGPRGEAGADAAGRAKVRRDFGWHLATYLIVNGFLVFVWSLNGGGFWPIWTMVPWGIGLAFHAAFVLLGPPPRPRRGGGS